MVAGSIPVEGHLFAAGRLDHLLTLEEGVQGGDMHGRVSVVRAVYLNMIRGSY